MEVKVKTILEKLPVKEIVGSDKKTITRVVSINTLQISDGDLLWVSDKNASSVAKIGQGTIICSALAKEYFNSNCTYLIVSNPRLYFLMVVKTFFVEKEAAKISPNSDIHPSVRLGKNVSIHSGVVIERDCVIGDETSIDSNTVIKKGTCIGARVTIGANNTIGGNGFGYEKNEDGEFEFIPHIGNVVIEDDVEIGNNTAIDRAVLGSTFIRKNAKIDNLVHIAHGVDIGENSLIIANSMIAGSTAIGKNVWVAPSASILNKLAVGDNAVIGMGAVVLKDVQTNQTVVGNPAKDLAALKKTSS